MERLNNLLHHSEKTGDPFAYDETFKGPMEKRTKTDVPFFVLFCIFIVGWLAVGIWAIATGADIVPQSMDLMHETPDVTVDVGKVINKYWWPVIVALILVMIASLILVFVMRWIAAPLLWTYIILLHIVFFAAAVSSFVFCALAEDDVQMKVSLIYGIVFTILFFFLALLVFAMRKRIKLALEMIKECSRAICKMWSTVFFPVIPAFIKIIVLGFALTVHINLVAKSEEIPRTNQTLYGFLQAYNVFGVIWATFFISALTEMTLAGTFGTWYWTYNKDEIPSDALGNAFRLSTYYHLGTVAFGSLIITFCRVLRLICNSGANRNDCGPLSFFRCFLACLESFLRRFNRNAYIMCSVHGKGLCTSAISAYQLILRNVMRYIAMDTMTGIIFGVSQILLAVGAGGITYACLYDKNWSEDERALVWIPIIILFIGAFVVSGAFFSVYAIAVDTLVLCFLEDCERNDGSDYRPYYMSKRLMKILQAEQKTDTYEPLTDDSRAHYNNY